MTPPDNAPLMNEHRAYRDAAFSETLLSLFNGGE
jgi:hypothetical protein